MKAKILQYNKWLEGFRTVLLMWGGWALMYADVFVGGLSGFGTAELKGAATIAALTTVKQIKTDIIPRIKAMMEGE